MQVIFAREKPQTAAHCYLLRALFTRWTPFSVGDDVVKRQPESDQNSA
jgi:hypothetical protein